MGDKMLVYGVPESSRGKYFEYGILVNTYWIKIIKVRSCSGNYLDIGDKVMFSNSDIVKIGGMVE